MAIRFVLQSLTMWLRVTERMFELWQCADADLLDVRSRYSLSNTGQGLNRVQSCPKVRTQASPPPIRPPPLRSGDS